MISKELYVIRPWLFSIFLSTGSSDHDGFDPAACQQAYDQYLARWTRADHQGFEGLFFAEHHFTPFSLSPSPNLLVAAVAQRTRRLRLGVMCNVVHLHDPRRLAEECAMLDYLTTGRLDIGVGAGGDPRETIRAGLDPAHTRARYNSGMAVLEAALTQSHMTRHDDYVQLDAVPLRPRPRQQPRPPIWVTSLSVASAQRAAKAGHNLALAWLPIDDVRALADAYRAQGGTSDGVALRRRVFVAPTDAEAEELVHAAPDTFIDSTVGPGMDDVRSFLSQPDDIIIGSPATVTERFVDQARRVGAGNLLLWTDFKAFAAAHLDRSQELLGAHVVPALRHAQVNDSARAA
jgi:alkanesulfonate monooxygenase SsuD/methylene tetrahydromethanopterin reductase-like flavin-dependent oxidoreductase (luciferase family)